MFQTLLQLVGATLLLAATISAQTFTANLTGVVSDPAGADIPNVRVKLENMATREKRETATGAEGRFTFSQLLPGVYQIQAEATGFKAFVQSNINLIAGQSAAVNFSMEIGSSPNASRSEQPVSRWIRKPPTNRSRSSRPWC